MSSTWLQLSLEQGGLRFGPFGQGHVALGSDGGQCHVVFEESLGVLWLQPSEVGAWLALFRRQSPATAEPISTAVALGPGDAFAIGAPHGPRFTVEQDAAPVQRARTPIGGPVASVGSAPTGQRAQARSTRPGPRNGRGLPSSQAMGQEIKRQLSTEAMLLGPVASARRLGWQASSGALFQPRTIIAAVIAAGGFAFTACAGLSSWLAAQ